MKKTNIVLYSIIISGLFIIIACSGYLIFNITKTNNYPEYENIPIDYLEYDQDIQIYDVEDMTNNFYITSGWHSNSKDTAPITYGKSPEINSNDLSKGIMIKKNNKELFNITFWQVKKNNVVEFDLIVKELYDPSKKIIKSTYKIYNITNLISTSDKCLNQATVCFDSDDMVVYAIDNISKDLKIDTDIMTKQNKRILHVENGINGTIFLFINVNDIMPSEEYDHYIVPQTIITIPIKLEDKCILDSNEKICLLEQRIKELEAK